MKKNYFAIKSILIFTLFLLGTCSSNDNSIEKTINNSSIKGNDNLKNHKINIEPAFIPVNISYKSDILLDKKDLSSLTPMELAILRIQIYDQNGYDFESTWKKWFYKEKYGYLIKPNYNEMDLKKNDMINDRLIVSVLENMRITNTHYNHFPVYIGHILREVFQTDNSIKYFTNITDKNPIPFKKDEIPSGINKPDFGSEIPREAWNGLVSGKKTFSDLGFPKEQNTIYLVKYYHNKNIKYIISYEAFGGRVSSQDCKNFSLYDPTGILRRNIYVVGNQEMYERDYYYNSKNEISKIIEKVSQNNQLSKVGIFEKNLKYVEPTTEKVIDTPKKN